MLNKKTNSLNAVHFIGIGGIGTSALARWFLKHNWKVSGSDAEASLITNSLKKEGVKIFIGHQAKNVSQKTSLVVHSAAILPENPEFKQSLKFKIPIKSYAELIGDLTKKYKTLAVAGSHGKSTTTALLSLVLIKAGLDPTVIVGTKLKEFNSSINGDGSNFRSSVQENNKENYLVLEADEYNKSFLNYSPFAAIITNIDREHLDIYKNLNEIKKSFLKFIQNIQPGGILIVNKDDKNLFSLKKQIQKIAKKNKFQTHWYGIQNKSKNHVQKKLKEVLKISGEHNLSNASAVYVLAKKLGVKEKDVLATIGEYRGAWRRMEFRGNLKHPKIKGLDIGVYDDYAHHPTEIKATLAGMAQKSPKITVICVFQPHQAKRLSALFKEFTDSFKDADIVIVLDIFKVKGRDEVSQNINSEKLTESIKKCQYAKSKKIIYLPRSQQKNLRKNIEKLIIELNQPAIIVMMGAGDIYKMTDILIN